MRDERKEVFVYDWYIYIYIYYTIKLFNDVDFFYMPFTFKKMFVFYVLYKYLEKFRLIKIKIYFIKI